MAATLVKRIFIIKNVSDGLFLNIPFCVDCVIYLVSEMSFMK